MWRTDDGFCETALDLCCWVCADDGFVTWIWLECNLLGTKGYVVVVVVVVVVVLAFLSSWICVLACWAGTDTRAHRADVPAQAWLRLCCTVPRLADEPVGEQGMAQLANRAYRVCA
jgi:hypothetical protein